MRCLVTGGAGFIGSHLSGKLVETGCSVRIIDDFSTGKKENLTSYLKDIELITGDIRDRELMLQTAKGMEVIFHQAALRSVPRSLAEPEATNSVNVSGTLNILMAARAANVRRVVYASSSSVYGNNPNLPQKETQLPSPISPYAVSKLAGEHYAYVFSKTFGLETVALRYFNVFGPRQDPLSQYAAVIPRFILWALKNEPLEIHGDGKQTRDFSYVDDVVQANLLAAQVPGISGKVFNVAGGKSISLIYIVQELEKIAGRKLTCQHTEARPGDVRQTWADLSDSSRYLNYRPRTAFTNGLKNVWDYFQKEYLR